MLGADYPDQNCSVARTLEVVGERWSLLVIRDAMLGVRRFEDFQRSLGISRNVLTARLTRLVELGVLSREAYSERPPRFEYRLTDRGRDLFPVILSMVDWGDRHAAPDAGAPRTFRHRDCGGIVDARHLICAACGTPIEGATQLAATEGPGAAGPPGTVIPNSRPVSAHAESPRP